MYEALIVPTRIRYYQNSATIQGLPTTLPTQRMSEALEVTTRTIDRDVAVLRKYGYITKSEKDNRSPWVTLKNPE